MKRILVGGIATALAVGGLGLTTGTSATASPLSGPGAQGASVCTILPVLCTPTTPGTSSVARALETLVAAGPSATPAQVQAVVTQLSGSGLPTDTLTTVVTEVVEQLQDGATGWPAGALDGDMLAATIGQVLAQLPRGAAPTDVPDVVTGLVGSVQRLVESVLAALTEAGGGVPRTSVLSDLASALLSGDTGAVTSALETLTESLDPASVRALVADIVASIGDLGGTGSGLDAAELRALLSSFITSVTDLAGTDGLPTSAVQALLTGLVDALTDPDAADPFGSLQIIARDLITVLRTFGTSTTTIIERLRPVSVTTPTPNPNPRPPAARTTLAAPSLSTPTYSTSKRPVFTGRGTAGATVTVRTTGGRALTVVRVAPDGGWSARSTTKLKRGAYRVVARQSATGRNTSRGSAVRSFRVVSAKPKLTSKKSTKANRPALKGIGFPGARIVVRTKGGKVLAKTRVKSDGTFKVRSKPLANGTYKTRATQKRGSQMTRSAYRTVRVR